MILYKTKMKSGGSIFILAIIFGVIMSVIISTLLDFQVNYHNINSKAFNRSLALINAESAIQLGLHEYRHHSEHKFNPSRKYANNSKWKEIVSNSKYEFNDGENSYVTVVN
ncbi:MAG: hypothetical protein ACD_79C00135G0001 [uncultured bacterium]|nr:MAG: hypothetical protein ACD_79C00135G0001 [uncultured bacterium]